MACWVLKVLSDIPGLYSTGVELLTWSCIPPEDDAAPLNGAQQDETCLYHKQDLQQRCYMDCNLASWYLGDTTSKLLFGSNFEITKLGSQILVVGQQRGIF